MPDASLSPPGMGVHRSSCPSRPWSPEPLTPAVLLAFGLLPLPCGTRRCWKFVSSSTAPSLGLISTPLEERMPTSRPSAEPVTLHGAARRIYTNGCGLPDPQCPPLHLESRPSTARCSPSLPCPCSVAAFLVSLPSWEHTRLVLLQALLQSLSVVG